MSGIAFVVLTNFHHNVLRWKRNDFDCRDQSGINFVGIFWFTDAGNAHAKFSVRRNVSYFFEPGGIFGTIRLH